MYIIFRVDNQSVMMDTLPIDLIASISSHLPIVDICHLWQTCRRYYRSSIFTTRLQPRIDRYHPRHNTAFVDACTDGEEVFIDREIKASRRTTGDALVRCAEAGHLHLVQKYITSDWGVLQDAVGRILIAGHQAVFDCVWPRLEGIVQGCQSVKLCPYLWLSPIPSNRHAYSVLKQSTAVISIHTALTDEKFGVNPLIIAYFEPIDLSMYQPHLTHRVEYALATQDDEMRDTLLPTLSFEETQWLLRRPLIAVNKNILTR